MQAKTKFEKLLINLSEASKLTEWQILHMQVQTAAMMYRFLTDDLDVLDIVISKRGKIRINKGNKPVRLSPWVKRLLVWAVYRKMENKVLINLNVN